tara:strand:- start:675 stop:1325 length:651 start_codon:yes stop_codon:yes gene_type:complete
MGFTLLEMLIALSLSVILAAMLFSSLHTYAVGTKAGQLHFNAKQSSGHIYQFISNQLRESIPLSLKVGRKRDLLFHGDNRQIIYVGHVPRHRSIGGLHKNSIIIDGETPRQSLIFSYERLAADGLFDIGTFVEKTPSNSNVLIADAHAIELEYFGVTAKNTNPNWVSQWPRTDRLPQLIRLRIEKSTEAPPIEIVLPVYANKMSRRAELTLDTSTP